MDDDLLQSEDPACIVDQVNFFMNQLYIVGDQHTFFQSCCRTSDHIYSLNVQRSRLVAQVDLCVQVEFLRGEALIGIIGRHWFLMHCECIGKIQQQYYD